MAGVNYVYPCRLGQVVGVVADGTPLPAAGNDVRMPPGTSHVEITYT